MGAVIVSALLCLRMIRRGESLKILEAGSLVVFGALTAYTLLAAPAWSVATVRLAVDLGLLAIAVVSLAIGRPFTLQYARERVPEPVWALPVFHTTNRLITAVWTGAFAVLVGADALAEYVAAVPIWVDVAASIAAFGAAVWFSRWYPAAVQRRFASVLRERGAQALGGERHVELRHAERRQRVDRRVHHAGGMPMQPASPTPLAPSGLSGDGRARLLDLDVRHVGGARDRVVHQRAGQELAVRVVDDLLHQRLAQALGEAAVELALGEERD